MTGQFANAMKPEKMSHNMRIYWDTILHFIPNISLNDLRWVANKSGNIYRDIGGLGACVDNYRVCRLRWTGTGSPSGKYSESQDSGCCGTTDQRVQNPNTKNWFLIGFNFGH